MPRLALLLFLASPALASDWAQFGGPAGTFTTPSTLPETFTDKAVAWRVPVGLGESGIVGDGKRLFTMDGVRDKDDATRGTERVVALDPKDGKPVWEHKYAVDKLPKGDTPLKGGKSGPQATPCVTGGRVIAIGYTGRVSALDAATGKVLWEKELTTDFAAVSPEFGFAGSPVPLGKLVLIPAGGKKGPALVALDAETGKEKWRAGDDAASCATPQIATLGREEQIVHLSRNKVSGYSPADGSELWTYKLPLAGLTNVPSPLVLSGDRVVISGQGVKGMRLLAVSKADGKFAVKEVWKGDAELFYCNAVAVGDTLYGATREEYGAVSLKDGEILWTDKKWKESNTVLAGGVPLVLSGKGRLARCEFTADGLTEKNGFDATGRAWTPPSVVGDRAYLRDGKEVVAVNLR
jgi:outer membrane protein assembly factor BamB